MLPDKASWHLPCIKFRERDVGFIFERLLSTVKDVFSGVNKTLKMQKFKRTKRI